MENGMMDNNLSGNNENKKSNKILITLLVIIALGILGFGWYFVYNNFKSNDKKAITKEEAEEKYKYKLKVYKNSENGFYCAYNEKNNCTIEAFSIPTET